MQIDLAYLPIGRQRRSNGFFQKLRKRAEEYPLGGSGDLGSFGCQFVRQVVQQPQLFRSCFQVDFTHCRRKACLALCAKISCCSI